MSGEHPWGAYLDAVDLQASNWAPATADVVSFVVAEVRRLRGSLHTILMMEGGPGVTGCPVDEGCRICEEVRGALAVPPPEDP